MCDVRRSFDWTAYIDHRSEGGPVLRVYGVCEMPTSGYSLCLRPLIPQGFNPTILILQLLEQRPESAPRVITNTPVMYEQMLEGLKHPILEVHITPINVKIPVREMR